MANETMNLNTPILTLDSDTVLETAQFKSGLIWHDIQKCLSYPENSHRHSGRY